jgi:hypothetical protein
MSTDTDHIDALVKRADPVDPLSLVGPDSPEAEDIWERVLAATSLGTATPLLSRPRPRRARRLILSAMSVGAVAAVVILVLQFLPTPALQAPSASAAVLRHLAEKAAAAEPTPILKGDQWLQSEFRVSYLAAPPHEGPESPALQSARAVVTVNAEDWANDLSQYCSQQVVTSVLYNSPASQQAWSSSGFGLPSTPQPGCGAGSLGSQAPGTLDVTRLPTDPVALAEALETGTTGIAALDRPPFGNRHYLTPFGRAVMLLVGPTFGATPALWSALLRVMATMPGVALLGTETTHSGTTGLALAGATDQGYRTTIILSPSTGALLEARNLLDFQLLAGLPTFGVLTIQWLDPIGTPQVVDASMLPSSLVGQVPTGIVSAVTNPGVTLDRWNAWLSSVFPELPGHPSAGTGVTGTPGVYGVSVVTHTPDPDVVRITRLFQESGLVHGITSAAG